MTRIRLTATSPGRWLSIAILAALGGWFGWGCLQAVVAPAEPWGTRLLAAAIAALLLSPWVVLVVSVPRRLRWMEVDGRGLRLRRGSGAVAVDLRWDELAGVGVVVDRAAARSEVAGASGLTRLLAHRVPPWLELVPADGAALRAHRELGAPVPPGDDQPLRWLVALNAGVARRPDVGAAVRRWRPGLWRGERDGPVPRGARAQLPAPAPAAVAELRRITGAEPAAPPPPDPAPAAPAVTDGPVRAVVLPRDARLLRAGAVALPVLVAASLLPAGAPLLRVLQTVVTGACLVVLVLVTTELSGPPRRLEADVAELRVVRAADGPPAWRVPWSDVSGVRLERRGRRGVLVLTPAGPGAFDAHPALAASRRGGGPPEWRLPLGEVGPEPGRLLAHRVPALWTGETAPAGR